MCPGPRLLLYWSHFCLCIRFAHELRRRITSTTTRNITNERLVHRLAPSSIVPALQLHCSSCSEVDRWGWSAATPLTVVLPEVGLN